MKSRKDRRHQARAIILCAAMLLLSPATARAAEGNPMWRMYNFYSGEHFYTASTTERDNLRKAGWTCESVGWIAPTSGQSVYRLYNSYVPGGDHHYTLSAAERDSLVEAGWTYEGVGWYSGGSVDLLRQYNPYAVTGSHNYTTSRQENDSLVNAGWRAEGYAWSGVGYGYAVSGLGPILSDSQKRQIAVDSACSQIGKPYGNDNDGTNWNCSGLTGWAWEHAGIYLWGGSTGQYEQMKMTGHWTTDVDELQPGDLVFYSYDGGGTVYHVAMYIGNGQVVHANGWRWGVHTSSIYFDDGYIGGCSPI